MDSSSTQYVQDVAAPLPLVLTETTNGQISYYIYGNDLLARVDSGATRVFTTMTAWAARER